MKACESQKDKPKALDKLWRRKKRHHLSTSNEERWRGRATFTKEIKDLLHEIKVKRKPDIIKGHATVYHWEDNQHYFTFQVEVCKEKNINEWYITNYLGKGRNKISSLSSPSLSANHHYSLVRKNISQSSQPSSFSYQCTRSLSGKMDALIWSLSWVLEFPRYNSHLVCSFVFTSTHGESCQSSFLVLSLHQHIFKLSPVLCFSPHIHSML